ncbi:sensor histidine kinase [Yaniella flava]|uniref:histidine kinase n=1 Tax=Yaniella flava TaxID=287930 RepID=A0ABN2UTR8_9MICC
MVKARLLKLRASLGDALLGFVVFLAVSWMITADQASDQPPDAIAYFWAFGLGALLLVRRSYPLVVLWVTVITLLAYYMAGYPAVGLSIPTAAALLSAAEFRRVLWPVMAATALLTISYVVRIAQGQDLDRIIGYELAGEVGLMAAAIALGVTLRLRCELQYSTARLVESTAREERSRSHAALAAERANIARDLHDTLGHQATVVSMYADVARQTVDHDPQEAQDALEVVTKTSSQMLSELRQTVKMLRRRQRHRTVTTLTALREHITQSIPLDVKMDIDPQINERSLSLSVQTAIYRIVQEALTNVLRHSEATAAVVRIHQEQDMLTVTVFDEGPARDATANAASGAGINGMAERAALLGGWLTALHDAQGFIVHAALPVQRQEES